MPAAPRERFRKSPPVSRPRTPPRVDQSGRPLVAGRAWNVARQVATANEDSEQNQVPRSAAMSRASSPQTGETFNSATNLREYGRYLLSFKAGVKTSAKDVHLQEGWLNALRQDLMDGIEVSMQDELEALRRDLSDRLSVLRADLVGLHRDSSLVAQDQRELLDVVRESTIRIEKAMDRDSATFDRAIEELGLKVGNASVACREDSENSRRALANAMESCKVDLEPVHTWITENRVTNDYTPVLSALTKSTVHITDMVAKVVEQQPRVDLSPVLSAFSEHGADIAPVLRTLGETRADFGPVLDCIRENRPILDLGPMFVALEACEERISKIVKSVGDRPFEVDIPSLISAVREQKLSLDFREFVSVVRETRTADMRLFLDAVERVERTLEASIESQKSTQSSEMLARVRDLVNSDLLATSKPRPHDVGSRVGSPRSPKILVGSPNR